jgi:hypothetical protein
MNQFSHASECPVSNFFENLQLKVPAPLVSLTPVANGKNIQSEKFNYFVWTPSG